MSDEDRGFIGTEVAHYCGAICYATGCPFDIKARMASMLRELQFCGQWRDGRTHCPVCDGNTHAPDCRLAALLKELP